MYVLGLDIGSSAAKVGLFTLEGDVAAATTRCYPTDSPQPGYKEQDPEWWWAAVVDGLRQVTRGVAPEGILALGAAGHISSFTFVDEAGRVLRPAIGFQDQRAVAELAELYRVFSRDELAAQLGIDLPPAATWPLPKLLWLRKHEPATLETAHRLLQAKDYINLRLTGEFASDPSSNRGMADLSNGGIAREVFARLALPEDLLPRLHGPEQVIGAVTRAVAEQTGLRAGLPVAAGWNDLNASVLGSGAVQPADTFNITGTSEHIGSVVAGDHRIPELVCAPFLPGRNLLYGVTSCGGGSLEWFSAISGRTIPELLSLAEATPAGAGDLLFLPYLEGERSPVWDARASGAFVGLRSAHGTGHLARAVLEGVAFGLRQILDIVACHVNGGSSPVVITGGASRSRLWSRIKTDVLGRSVVATRQPHAGMLGAAILASVAASRYPDCDSAASGMAKLAERFFPAPEHGGCYQGLYSCYCELYPALRNILPGLHRGEAHE